MDEPPDHIRRTPMPWRKPDLTECGRLLTDVKTWIDYDEVKERIKKWGKQRTAFTVCMSCASAAHRYDNPYLINNAPIDLVEIMRREVFGKDVERLNRELRAIAALIEAHRDEFDGYLTGLNETIDIRSRRRRAR